MSDKEVKIRITGDVSDIEKKVKSLSDKLENMGKDVSGKGINDMVDGLNKAVKVGENFADTVNDIANSSNKVDKKNSFSNMASDVGKANKELTVTADNIKNLGKGITSIDTKKIDAIKELAATSGDIQKVAKSFNNIDGNINISNATNKIKNNTSNLGSELTSAFVSGTVAGNIMASTLGEVTSEIKDVIAALNNMDEGTALKSKVHTFDKFAETLKKAREEVQRAEKDLANLYNELDNRKFDLDFYKDIDAEDDDVVTQTKKIAAFEEKIQETQGKIKGFTEELNRAKKALGELTAQEDKYADEFDDQLGKYEKLGGKIADVVKDQEQHILVQKRLAQAYEQTSKSMSNMSDSEIDYKEVSKDVERLTKDAREYIEATSLMNFDNLNDDLKRLTKSIDEKIEKTKELKEANNAMDDQTRSTVYGLEREAEALREYADTAGYAFKHIAEKAGTDEEWQLVGNAKALEKAMNPQKLREYNKAISEYMHTINESNGQISSRFLNEDGTFSPAKYIADLERFGKPMNQLIANYKSLKQQALEYLKVGEKENEILAKQAKERLENITPIRKEAEALKEKAEATVKATEKELESLKKRKQGIDANLEMISSEVKVAQALKDSGEATEEQNRKLQENIELQKEHQKMSENLANQITEADKKATKAKQDLTEATEKLTKAQKEEAKAQDILNRSDRETKINNAKKKIEEAEAAQKSAKAKLEEAQAAERAAKAAQEEAEAQRRALSIKEQGSETTKLSTKLSKELSEAVSKSLKTMNEYEDAVKKTAEAQEKLDKSTKDVADAKEKLAKAEKTELDNKRDLVEQVNKEADALKKLGAAVERISLDEIRNLDGVDKTLATKLKDLFPNDLPKTFSDFKEHIKAAFSELNDLELGNFGSLLKDAGAGLLKNIFAKLPAQVKVVTAAVAGLGIALNKLYEAGKRQFFEGLSNIKQKLQPVISLMRSFGREAITAFESITGTHIDLSSLMELGPNFEYQMQKVATIAGSNDKQLAKLTKSAETLGGTTQFTATQVGEAFEYMAMAGYSTEDMLNSINGVLHLSIASGSDLAKTSDIVTDYMTAMGMEASQTSDFVDKLAATVTSSNTNVEQFGMSMKQVASQAGSLGITMTDLSTAIGLSANAGVKGAKAGTALKNILTNMASPTKKQAKALKELGFTADETGGYFKLTADGAVDLEATVKQLMTSTDKMTRAQKAATLAQFAGREALPGLMALLSQGAEGWDELSETIENSTGKMQFWNECMNLAGKSGKEASDLISNMKTVFAETEMEAAALGLSTEDLSHAIALLGKDGKVSSKNVTDLLNVVESMNTATDKTLNKWIELGTITKNDYVMGFDYDGTIAKLTADTQGLTQAQKEELKTRLENVKTYKDAQKIATDYQKELNRQNGTSINLTETVQRNSFATMDYVDKLKLLRDAYKHLGWKEFEEEMRGLGLGDSLDEINEIVKMGQTEFDAYTKNLETVKGMAEQMAEAMDEVTKGSLLTLASAIENVCIGAFNNLKPVIKGVTDEVNKFFEVWHDFEDNEFTFDGLEKALDALANGGKFKNNAGEDVIIQGIKSQEGKIKQAVVDLFGNIKTFVTGGSLDSLLNIGSSIVKSICNGIQEAKSDGSLDAAISGTIKKIATWIKDNGPMIEEAGVTILESLKSGIEGNAFVIEDALDVVCDILGSWASKSTQLEDTTALFADKFAEYFVTSTAKSFGNKANEIMTSISKIINPNLFDGFFESQGAEKQKDPQKEQTEYYAKGGWFKDAIKKGWEGIKSWFTGESYAAELGETAGTQFSEGYNTSLNTGKETTVATANDIGTGISEGIMSKLETMDATQLQALGTELTNLQTTTQTVATGMGTAFTTIQNSARTSFMGFTNIVRNQLLNCTNIVRNQALNMSNIFRNQFVSMANIARNQFVNLANIVRNQMVNAANIVRNQAVNMANIFRNQFTSMSNVARNQMVNVSNIIRNQSVSWSNIIRNQITNSRNTFTSQMISMAAVARTQMTNVSNIVRNQAVSWANVIRNQSANMKAAFSSAFSGLAAVAARGMAACLSTVRSYMSQIRAATSQTMTMNFRVNKTMTTTNVTKNVVQGLSNTMGNIARNSASLIAPQAVSIGGSIGTNRTVGGLGSVESLQLSVPLTVDGREIARATARYNQDEIAKLSKRNNRRRGEN